MLMSLKPVYVVPKFIPSKLSYKNVARFSYSTVFINLHKNSKFQTFGTFEISVLLF